MSPALAAIAGRLSTCRTRTLRGSAGGALLQSLWHRFSSPGRHKALTSPPAIRPRGFCAARHRNASASVRDSRTMASGGASSAPCRIAVAQMTSTDDHEHNLRTCTQIAESARDRGCQMLLLPECFAFLGRNQDATLAQASPLDGPIFESYRKLARDTGLWLSCGGFHQASPDAASRKLLNTHVVLDAHGNIVAEYRKVHLFDVDVPDGPVLMESRATAPGDRLVACDSPAGRLGLTVCYDVRFPEVYQRLAFDFGAQVMLVPSAFTRPTGAAHWEVLLRARAIETQAYVVAAAQAGEHPGGRASWGHSMVVDPWGEVVAKLDDPDATGIAVAEIDLEKMARIRERMPIAAHRAAGRPAVFADAPHEL
ncbi:unnamed protein product [Pedinophyceae sp. YPF-701]|nr:unnamed protein product [Pedinophyceae sp. YPF-701]